ncbi:MAG: rubrerythrin family protein [archaeon]
MNETIKNLALAFVGESQARNRYSIYAEIAKEGGHTTVAEVFLLTADNEREHAKWNYRMLSALVKKSGGDVSEINIPISVPLILGDTKENLRGAIAGEHHETATMYPDFARAAEKEGFNDVAARIRAIGMAEEHHRKRYKRLLDELEGRAEDVKADGASWVCSVCGYVHKGNAAPSRCPSCDSPREKFRRESAND